MFLTRRFFLLLVVIILVTASGYLLPPMLSVGWLLLAVFACLVIADAYRLWGIRGIEAARECADRFSNGDGNRVTIVINNRYAMPVWLEVIDEAPVIFQRRDVSIRLMLNEPQATVDYVLTPKVRGVYSFGRIRIFVATRLRLLVRRYTCGELKDVKVYPSYMALRHYELLAISNRLTDQGIKRIRRVGHNTDFEQIKDYVNGDDYRTINWRATARRHQLMVNVYCQERSQQVFALIDKGRVMQQSFQGMTLLDYAINASLVLSYVAIRKEDRAGLVTFADRFSSFIPASRKPGHLQTVMDTLYAEQTVYGETDFTALVAGLNSRVGKRSLLVLYTNFTTLSAMRRQLPSLRQLARRHRLLVVFFEDVDLLDYAAMAPTDTEDYYQHVIAEKFVSEQRLIVSSLRQYGIVSLLTTPTKLTVDVVNRYLEMKATW